MSISDTRAAIAAALSTVTDIHGHEFRPSTVSIGDGWPRFDGAERAGGATFEATWVVTIALPPDPRGAGAWTDSHIEDLFAVLAPILFIDRFDTVPATVENTGTSYLQITGRAE